MSRFQNARKRAERRVWPIHGYVGPNGGGKSAAMVWDTLPTLVAGRPVLSTVRILDFANPRPCEGVQPGPDGVSETCTICAEDADYAHRQAHPLWRPLVDWGQLLEAKELDVLLDEVTGVASSRESHSMPAPVANKLVQLRRADVVVRWSAPSWARADKIIRETSQAVTHCQGYMSKQLPPAEDGTERLWRQRRLARWRTYDAQLFEEFTVGKREQMRSMVRDWHWIPTSPAVLAYDTYDSVLTVGTVTESGTCYRCGGTRRRPACSCGTVTASRHSASDQAGPTEWVPEPGPGRRALRVLET